MRLHETLTASAALLSAHALLVFGNEVDYTVQYHQPREIRPEVAAGGLQKLIDRGVLRLDKSPKKSLEAMYVGEESFNTQGNRRRILQTKHAKGETKEETTVETRSTGHRGHHGGTRAGAKQRQHHESATDAPTAPE
jgi:hypothetical protein